MADKIQDFGEKIGGARKDIWSVRGLSVDDLQPMNAAERSKYVKKNYVWPCPNWQNLLETGGNQAVLYWQNEMRKAFPVGPMIEVSRKGDENALKETQEKYVEFCSAYRDAVMAVSSIDEIKSFADDFIVGQEYATKEVYGGNYITFKPENKAAHCLTDKMVQLANMSGYSITKMEEKAAQKLFGIANDQKVYVSTKASLKAAEVDGYYCRVGKDPYSQALRITMRVGAGEIYFYDRNPEHNPESYRENTYVIVDLNRHCVVTYNVPDVQHCDSIIEAAAVAAQEKDNLIRAEGQTKANDNRKKAFPLQKLETMTRSGPEYLQTGTHAGENDFLHGLGFRAGEFGNWLTTDAERQKHLDMAYDSLRDLAKVLNIDMRDVSLGQKLAIAFGSRGRGGKGAGAAHYEPARNVINLTRMSGAGCLAHEFGHSLDAFLGQQAGAPTGKLLTEIIHNPMDEETAAKIPKAFAELIQMMKTKTVASPLQEAIDEKNQRVSTSQKRLNQCFENIKPYNMTAEQCKRWDSLVDGASRQKSSLTGMEYFSFRSRDRNISTYAPLEELSDYRKAITGHGISKNEKMELVRQLKMVNQLEHEPVEKYQEERVVATDFYEGSRKFDGCYSKVGGYWSSDAEMFARAFDCYIEDKLRNAGLKNDYLSSHASAFAYVDAKGKMVRAVPYGEERTAIDQKFDELVEQCVELGVFHENDHSIDKIHDEQGTERTPQLKLEDSDYSMFAVCPAVAMMTPRTMTTEQNESWTMAVCKALEDRSEEALTALSELRKDIVGRDIPQMNLKMISKSADAIYHTVERRDVISEELSKGQECEPHQISFGEIMR